MVQKVTVICQCGARLAAPASAAGRQARCPRCKRPNTVPFPAAVPSPAGAPQPEPQPLNPNAPGAVPFVPDDDFAPGETAEPGQARRGMLRGTRYALAGIAVACGAWYVAAFCSGTPLTLFVLAVGIAAGMGMRLGTQWSRIRYGVVGALLAGAAIVGTQFVIFQRIVLPIVQSTNLGDPMSSVLDRMGKFSGKYDLMNRRTAAEGEWEEAGRQGASPEVIKRLQEKIDEVDREIEIWNARQRAQWRADRESFALFLGDCNNISLIGISLLLAAAMPIVGKWGR